MSNTFHQQLKEFIDDYIFEGFQLCKKFPKDERYEMTSQVRRALLSIMLNYIEGYGRTKKKVLLNFYETSFGSLKESIYIYYLALRLNYITISEYKSIYEKKENIARMLWKTIQGVKKDIKEKA